ncbi:MAG: LysM peptidoglycan-binding domain-containing protein [Candidatus Riflebacteria bacterium]|nr:LysM peptidoglycan-binding domain-containing protein [Candidatus Riflebacteria bacterium]
MRQELCKIAILGGLFLSSASLMATPVLGGYYFGKGTGNTGDKPVFLAHIFNCGKKVIELKKMKMGIEIRATRDNRKFHFSSKESLSPGEIRTFRLSIPVNTSMEDGTFRIFGSMNEKNWYSDLYTFKNTKSDLNDVKNISLYAEPPVEEVIPTNTTISPENVTEIPDLPSKKQKNQPETKIAEVTKNQKSEKKSSSSKKTGKEFKSLRTIDEELIIYIVKNGDTLQSIANKYYGNQESFKIISELNFIEPDTRLKGGEEIIVEVKPLNSNDAPATVNNAEYETPAAEAPAGTQVVAETAVQSGDAQKSIHKEYIVEKGDTIGSIAKKILGRASKYSQILKLNPTLNPKNLKIGMKIAIPSDETSNPLSSQNS